MAKRFFYVCAGMLLLALSYHLGATTATAQAPSNSVVASWESVYGGNTPSIVVTANGDVYAGGQQGQGPWTHRSNVFAGAPTPALHESWGQLKSRYAPSRGTAQPGTQDR